ncbi:MAG: phage terminase large subunit [Dehalococcoides mccartyi]|uniref:phage terminase large subunit n=1 Tax=Dehalococcoides mccartyi TaxID=61435 RepID=UPI0030FD08E6
MDKFISGEIKRLMVFMPPQNGKSELVSRRLPAFILGQFPDDSIIATSYGADLASMMNRDVQRIIDGDQYPVLFPDTKLFGENVRTVSQGAYLRNSDIFEVVGHKGYYKSAGIGGSITGIGCIWGIIDDPIKNRAEAESITYRNSIWDWYTSTFQTRLRKDARILLTMTRWHEDDLAGRLLKLASSDPAAEQWTVVCFPAIADGQLMDCDPRKAGEPLWPERYSLETLLKTKATAGGYGWESLYQQRPSSPSGNILSRSWWKYYRQPPSKFDSVIQSWDCSFKDSAGTDYVVGQVWGRAGADKYLLDQVRARMDFPASIASILALSAKWPKASAKLIEDKANGPAIISTLKHRIAGLIPIEPAGGKIVRAQAASPDIEAGNVYLPENTSWVSDFVEECANFPNGAHDDQVDAMSQAINYLNNCNTYFDVG